MMRRMTGILLLLGSLAVQAQENPLQGGLTIYGDEEQPKVQTDLPWQRVDIEAYRQYSLDKLMTTVFAHASAGVADKLIKPDSGKTPAAAADRSDRLRDFLNQLGNE